MCSIRTLLVMTLVISGIPRTQARSHPKPLTAADAEARNETATPSLSGQVREAHRVANYLVDALVLNNAQQHAVEAYTVAERIALTLAFTPTDAAQAQCHYLVAVRRVLATSQLDAYVALRQQLAGTMLPLDGTEVALR